VQWGAGGCTAKLGDSYHDSYFKFELFHYSIHLAALRLIAVEADVACMHDCSRVGRGFLSPQYCTAARRDALRLCAHCARSARAGLCARRAA
jgi:hypothetical protein